MAVTHLRALQALELAIRKGSLKEAAATLAITPAALGQRIRALEDYLGFDLLVRGRSGTRPTKELDAAMAHLSAAFRELDTVARILDFQRVNEIHISADTDWADLWLKPRLEAFKADNPNILFCVNGVGDVPLRLGQADCEIWFGPPDDADGADLLFHDYLMPVSSLTNVNRIAARDKSVMLEGFPLLHLDCYTRDGGGIGWPEWVAAFGYRQTAPGLGIRYQKVMHALEAVYADSGFIICGMGLVMHIIDAGRLSTVFPRTAGAPSRNAYYARFRRDALRKDQLARFREWLIEQSALTQSAVQPESLRFP